MPTGSVRFPSLNDHSISRTTLLPPIDHWTIMAWVKISVDRDATSVFWKFGHAGDDFLAYRMQCLDNGTQLLGWCFQDEEAGFDLHVGQWYHLAQTCYGTGQSQFLTYIDGRLAFVVDGNPAIEGQELTFGDWRTNGSDPMNGCLAAIKIWDVPLNQQEIRREMRQYTPARTAHLNTFSPLRSLDELSLNYANQGTPWNVIGTHADEEGPPIPWTARRVSPVRYFDFARIAGTTLTVIPAYMSWRAQPPTLARIIAGTPARAQWHAQALSLARSQTLLPARLQWHAQPPTVTESGEVVSAATGSMRFTGVSGQLLYRTEGLPPIDCWTIMAWAKISVDRNAISTFWKFGGTGSDSYLCQLDSNGTKLAIGNGEDIVRGANLQVGQWYHIAMTCYGTGNAQFLTYVNGVVDVMHAGSLIPTATQLSLGDWKIDGTEPINGCLAAVKIWNVPLNQAEIRREMRQYTPARTTHLNTFSPLRTTGELTLNYAMPPIPWTVTVLGTYVEEEAPPITWRSRPLSPLRSMSFGPEHRTIRAEPAVQRWTANVTEFPPRLTIIPARLQWRAITARVAQPFTLVMAELRALVSPRLRYAPIRDLNHAEVERRGLVAWYLAQPWQFTGDGWIDMVRGGMALGHNMPVGNAVAGWDARSHLGGRGAMGFDGSAMVIQAPAEESTSNLHQITLSLWLYPRSFGPTGKVRLLDKMGIDGFGGWSVGLSTVETVSRAIEFNADGLLVMTAYSADNAIDLHTWTHLTVVWDGSYERSTVRFFLNGEQIVTSSSAGNNGQGPPNLDTNQLMIGNRDALDRGFDGWVNDIRIYAQVLPADEIRVLYQDSFRGAPRLLRQPRIPFLFPASPVVLLPITRTVTPAYMQWQAHALRLARAVTTIPARLQWQASSPTVSVSVSVSAARIQWRVPAHALTQTISASLAHMQWRAQVPLLTRVGTLVPARLQWQASTPTFRGIVTTAPARVQWQARVATQTRTGVVTPARAQWAAQIQSQAGTTPVAPAYMQWRAQLPQIPRVGLAARMQWRGQTPALSRTIVDAPARVLWQAQAVRLTRTATLRPSQVQWHTQFVHTASLVRIEPVRLQWRAPTLIQAQVLIVQGARVQWQGQGVFQSGIARITPTRIQWQTPMPLVTRFVTVTPAEIGWRASTPALASVQRISAVQMQWHAQTPRLSRVLVVSAARGQWQTQAPALSRTIATSSARMQWRAQAPTETQTINISAAVMQWHAQAPRQTRFFASTPARVQWQARTPTLTRVFAVFPCQMMWRAQSPALTRGITAAPAQVTWQTQTQSAVPNLVIRPAQVAWETQILAQTHVVSVAPAQMQWQTRALFQAGVARILPTRMQWQAHIQPVTRTLRVTPGRMLWHAGTGVAVASLSVAPNRMQWRAQALLLQRVITAAPAQMAWHSQTLLQTRGVVIRPAHVVWQAETLFLSRVITLAPAQMAWHASMPTLVRGLTASHAHVAWQTQTLQLGSVVIVRVAQIPWQAETLRIGRVITARAAQIAWQGDGLHLTREVVVRPAHGAWQAETPFLGRVITGTPARGQWAAHALFLSRVLAAQPVQMAWRAQDPYVTRVLTASPAQEPWHAHSNPLMRTIIVLPCQQQWVAQQIAMTRGLTARTAQEAWAAKTPTLVRVITVESGQVQWQAQAVRTTRTIQTRAGRIVWAVSLATATPNLVLQPSRMQWQSPHQLIPRILLPSISHMRWQASEGIARGPDTLILQAGRMRWTVAPREILLDYPRPYGVSDPVVMLVVRQSEEAIELPIPS